MILLRNRGACLKGGHLGAFYEGVSCYKLPIHAKRGGNRQIIVLSFADSDDFCALTASFNADIRPCPQLVSRCLSDHSV